MIITNLEVMTLNVYDKTLEDYLEMIATDEGTITREALYAEISSLTDEDTEDIIWYLIDEEYLDFDGELEYRIIK